MNNIIYNLSDRFPVSPEFQTIYRNMVEKGSLESSNKKIMVLSIIRNIASKYKYCLKTVKDLLKNFHESSCVCLYENDSIDSTATMIKDHISNHEGYDNFYLFSETLNTPYLPLSKSKIRTTALANARNKCYNLSKSIMDHPDFYIVLDMDFTSISIEGILNTFGWLHTNSNISAMCGNSYLEIISQPKSLHNYDSFAFRLNYWEYMDPFWFPNFNLPIGSIPIPVNSGFGGCCVYKSHLYEDLYTGEDCEHVTLHKSLKLKYKEFNLYYNPSQILLLH